MASHSLFGALVMALVAQTPGAVLPLSSVRDDRRGRTAAIAVESRVAESGKPMMGMSDAVRAMACWGRPDLLHDEHCMLWLAEHCRSSTTGVEICYQFEDLVKAKCKGGEDLSCKTVKVFEDGSKSKGKEKEAEASTGEKEEEQQTGGEKEEEQKAEEPHSEEISSEEKNLGEEPAVEEPMIEDPTTIEDPKVGEDPVEASDAASMGGPAPSPVAATMWAPAAAPEIARIGQHELGKLVPDYGLPDQGVSEHSSDLVVHKDAETQTSDWGKEWPQTEESEGKSKEQICKENPNNNWCKMYLHHRQVQYAESTTEAPGIFGNWR